MSPRIRSLAAPCAALVVAAGVASCGSSVTGTSVAVVGGTPITVDQFDHWLVVAAASPTASPTAPLTQIVVPEPPDFSACVKQEMATAPKPAAGQKPETVAELRSECLQEYDGLGSQVISFLITSQWVLSEAVQEHVSVTPQAVIQEYDTEKKEEFPTATEFETFLRSSQETVPDLLFRTKLDLLSEKIRDRVTAEASRISPAAIAQYYNEHKDQYGTAAARNLELILTKTAAQAAAAKAAIVKGAKFATIAEKDSIDPASRTKGGVLDDVSEGTEEETLNNAIFAARLGVLTGPVSTPFGYYVFEVTKITPGTQQTLAQVTPRIRTTLQGPAENTAVTNFVNDFQTRWRAKTTCRTPFVTPFEVSSYCGNLKAPKAASPTAAASGTTVGTPTASVPTVETATTPAAATTTKTNTKTKTKTKGAATTTTHAG